MSPAVNLTWNSPGPVSSRFMACRMPFHALNGPIGSAKTTTCLFHGLQLATEQRPSTIHRGRGLRGEDVPLRRFKLCVVRDTYRQLWRSTLPSWFERVPKELGDFTGAENAPAAHKINFALSDGTMVGYHIDFVAIGDNKVEDVLRGYEPTAFYLNELDLLVRDVLTYAKGRTGRFPGMAEGGPSWHGVFADLNAPEFGNWTYEDFFTKTPEELAEKNTALFRQPSGLSPQAENRKNLVGDYYERQVKDQPAWYVSRMVENKPGVSRAGKPVYSEFNDSLHVPDRVLMPAPGIVLTLGLDAGGSPAAVAGQRMPNGQWRILRELVAEQGTGAQRFGDDLNKWLMDEFPEILTIVAYADPSAAYGADKQAGESSWIEIVAAKTRLNIRAAPTNAPIPRWEAVRRPLSRLIDGEPGMLIDPSCKVLRMGFNAGYRYKKRGVPGAESYNEDADKNEFSHPHDALQYLCSGGGEDKEIRARGAQHQQQMQQARGRHVHDWDPMTGEAL